MELTQRDYLILRTVHKFRFCLGRQIMKLAGFNGQRATDRRLRTLVDGSYIKRQKYLYGTPYLYTLTHKGRILISVNKREEKIRVDQIFHDIYVVDAVIFFIAKYSLSLKDIDSEKELHIKDGFGNRKHQPDFVFTTDEKGKKYAVEIELNLKTKGVLEKNIKSNFLNYDGQIWITNNKKVLEEIQSLKPKYSNIKILFSTLSTGGMETCQEVI